MRRASGSALLLAGVLALGVVIWRSGSGPEPVPAAIETRDRAEPVGNARRLGDEVARRPELEHRGAIVDRPPAPEAAPNVVLVLACTVRRDQVTPYGGLAHTTPFLDELARAGTRFDDVIASSAWTKESSTAIFTGHQALAVGMTDPTPRHSVRVLSERVQTLAERFQSAGWYTLGITANPHLNRIYGFGRGYDRYRDTSTSGFKLMNKISGRAAVEATFRMLDERTESRRPFYARLVMIDSHDPIDVDESQVEMYRGEEVSNRVARYRAGLRQTDEALRALDEGLLERGFTADNTLFVVITDHGEGLSMPRHHRGQHGRVLYHSVTQVPWILRGPGVARGHVVKGLASHLDVAPTLLGLSGLAAPELEGRDWSNLIRAEGERTDRTHAYSDTWYFGVNRAAVFTATRACQKDWGSVGIKNDQFVEGCFDRVADPDFTEVVDEPALMDHLVQCRLASDALYAAWPDTRDANRDDTTLRQLEALGYVE